VHTNGHQCAVQQSHAETRGTHSSMGHKWTVRVNAAVSRKRWWRGIAPLGIISIGSVPMGVVSIGVVPMGGSALAQLAWA